MQASLGLQSITTTGTRLPPMRRKALGARGLQWLAGNRWFDDDADRLSQTKKVARGKVVGHLQSINLRGRSRFDGLITKHAYLVTYRLACLHLDTSHIDVDIPQAVPITHAGNSRSRHISTNGSFVLHLAVPTLLQRLCICRERK